jgi:hypothetical protein
LGSELMRRRSVPRRWPGRVEGPLSAGTEGTRAGKCVPTARRDPGTVMEPMKPERRSPRCVTFGYGT